MGVAFVQEGDTRFDRYVEWVMKEKTTSNMETYVVAASFVPAVHSSRSIDTASLKQLLSWMLTNNCFSRYRAKAPERCKGVDMKYQ